MFIVQTRSNQHFVATIRGCYTLQPGYGFKDMTGFAEQDQTLLSYIRYGIYFIIKNVRSSISHQKTLGLHDSLIL